MLSPQEKSALARVLKCESTRQALINALANQQMGVLFSRKPLSTSMAAANQHSRQSTVSFAVVSCPDLPRKILIRFEQASGQAITDCAAHQQNPYLGLYLYPKSKLSGGLKHGHKLPHLLQTTTGRFVQCEPVVAIHARTFRPMVVLSQRDCHPGCILTIQPHHGMNLDAIMQQIHSPSPSLTDKHPAFLLRRTWIDRSFSLENAWHIMNATANCIIAGHQKTQHAHLDIKRDNILIQHHGELRLIDWPDLSSLLPQNIVHSSPGYSVISSQHRFFQDAALLINPALVEALNACTHRCELSDLFTSQQHGHDSLLQRWPQFAQQAPTPTCYLDEGWIRPHYLALYHDTWALLTVTLDCFQLINNLYLNHIAQHAVITVAIALLNQLKTTLIQTSQMALTIIEAPEHYTSPEDYLTTVMNQAWSPQLALTRIHEAYKANHDDFYQLNTSSFVPGIIDNLSSHDTSLRMARLHHIFNGLAYSLDSIYQKYRLAHLAIAPDSIKLYAQGAIPDWHKHLQPAQSLTFDPGISNISPKHHLFSQLGSNCIALPQLHDYHHTLGISSTLSGLFQHLQPQTQDNLVNLQSHHLHDSWSCLYLYLACHMLVDETSADRVCAQTDELLMQIVIIETANCMLNVLKAYRNAQYDAAFSIATLFQHLTHRVQQQYHRLAQQYRAHILQAIRWKRCNLAHSALVLISTTLHNLCLLPP